MGFTTSCFIRKNTSQLQNKLADIGYSICRCANFTNAEWLNTLPMNGTIHGKGYFDAEMEFADWTVEKELSRFVSDNPKYVDCGENEDLFLAIAALRDDSDVYQYFVNEKGMFVFCNQSELKHVIDNSEDWWDYSVSEFHKATVAELIEHFK